MTHKKAIISIAAILLVFGIGIVAANQLGQTGNSTPVSSNLLAKRVKKPGKKAKTTRHLLTIRVGQTILKAKLANNSSVRALVKKIPKKGLTLHLHDYGNFEKVGNLPWTLPENNETMNTKPGDIILYQGNQLSIYYGTNSWSLTPIARIKNAQQQNLSRLLGKKSVTVRLSL